MRKKRREKQRGKEEGEKEKKQNREEEKRQYANEIIATRTEREKRRTKSQKPQQTRK